MKGAKRNELPPCPYCGADAVAVHMFDGNSGEDNGWNVGCKRYHAADKVHDHSLAIPKVSGYARKQDAEIAWGFYCKQLRGELA